MTLRVQGTISINGAQAKAEAKAVASELRKVGTEATGMGRASQEAAAGANALGKASQLTAAEVRALIAAERQAAAEAVALGRSHNIGASGVANLTAQFNDIGVMLAAGQNPLQLAIQQGTQITQVFGNMGAAAALRGLGQALLSMVSPLNLITIGGIAAGAAIIQWVFQAGEKVESLDDALQSLADNTKAYAESNSRARATTVELREEFGLAAEEARALYAELSDVQRLQAEGSASGVAGSIRDQVTQNSWMTATFSDQGTTARFFDLKTSAAGAWREVNRLLDAFEKVENASSLDETIAAYAVLREQIKSIADFNGVRSQQEQEMIAGIIRQELELLRLQRERSSLSENNGRKPGLEAAQAALDYRLQEQAAIREANASAQQMIATLQAEGQIRQQIAIFGRDSELVAQSRLAIERDLVAAQLEAEGIVGAMADAVLAAWDNAKGFSEESAVLADILTRGYEAVVAMVAAAPGGGWLAGAIADADTLAGKLWDAAAAAASRMNAERELSQMKFEFSPGGQALGKYGGRGGTSSREITDGRGQVLREGRWVDPDQRRGGSGRGRGGGGSKEAREERDAVKDLIEQLEREIALERELDPVKREMIRYREQMKEATAGEREAIEQLITQREREKAATESMRWVSEQTGDALVDALMGGADAGERLIETLKRAVLQALLLGNGPLKGLFGGGLFGGLIGGGGLFGGGDLFNNIVGLAEGGMVFGQGGPTDDKVPRWLSPGEFVVNAKATRRHRHMLEGLNAAPGMATGGLVGGGAAGQAVPGSVTIAPVIDARGSNDPKAVEDAARKGMMRALDEYRRTGLPNDILRTLDSPNVRRF